MRNSSAAATEDLDVARAALLQLPNDFCKELDVSAVVARNPNRSHIFLNGGTHDVLRVTMVAEIDHLDSVPNELKVDGVDRAVVPITNRHSSENTNRRGHELQILAAIACPATAFA